jgi:enoyl-CoA hydratase
MEYADYPAFTFDRPDRGVLLIRFNRPEKLNALDKKDHEDLARLWLEVQADGDTRVAVITGTGRAFCAGGSIQTDLENFGDVVHFTETMKAARDLVYNLVNCDKPIISAINGPAAGAGLTTALLADISVIAEEARFTDGHLRIGVAAGDHAAIIWPLLCGIARAKYYLYTSEVMDGREAERIGLVSRCVPAADLMDTALGLASRLAAGPQQALRYTKHSINHWIRAAAPIFESSLALEMLNFLSEDAREGLTAFLAKRPPEFPSAFAGPTAQAGRTEEPS